MRKWGFNYWGNYAPVVNCISVRSLLAIESTHELSIRSNDFVLALSQSDLDLDVFMELHLGMGFDGNRG